MLNQHSFRVLEMERFYWRFRQKKKHYHRNEVSETVWSSHCLQKRVQILGEVYKSDHCMNCSCSLLFRSFWLGKVSVSSREELWPFLLPTNATVSPWSYDEPTAVRTKSLLGKKNIFQIQVSKLNSGFTTEHMLCPLIFLSKWSFLKHLSTNI